MNELSSSGLPRKTLSYVGMILMQIVRYFIQALCAFQILIFFAEDSRWSYYRNYLIDKNGKIELGFIMDKVTQILLIKVLIVLLKVICYVVDIRPKSRPRLEAPL